MSTSAVCMLVFGLLITWGGASLCILKAMKSKKES